MELDEQLKSLIEGAKREAVAEYKKGLALVVYEYPAGCTAGKQQFLSELDIEWPYASYQTEVHIRALNDGNVQAVMRQIELDLQRNYDTDSITVNVGSWESVDDED